MRIFFDLIWRILVVQWNAEPSECQEPLLHRLGTLLMVSLCFFIRSFWEKCKEAGVLLIWQKYLQTSFPNGHTQETFSSRYFLHSLTKRLSEYIVVFVGVYLRDIGKKHWFQCPHPRGSWGVWKAPNFDLQYLDIQNSYWSIIFLLDSSSYNKHTCDLQNLSSYYSS